MMCARFARAVTATASRLSPSAHATLGSLSSAAAVDLPLTPGPLSEAYADLVASGATTLDPQQLPAITALDATLTRAATSAAQGSASAAGLYLHGSVGVGKSFLMDLAYVLYIVD